MELYFKNKQTLGDDWRGALTAGSLCQLEISEGHFNWSSVVGHMTREELDKPAPHWAISNRSFYAAHLTLDGASNIYAHAIFKETPLSVTPRKFK